MLPLKYFIVKLAFHVIFSLCEGEKNPQISITISLHPYFDLGLIENKLKLHLLVLDKTALALLYGTLLRK